MTYNLRLPPELDAKARSESLKRYTSLNSLICQALASYLKDVPAVPVNAPAFAKSPMANGDHVKNHPAAPGPGATKKERQAWTTFQRQQRKLEPLP